MRTRSRPRATCAQTLTPVLTHCPECRQQLYADYASVRTVTTLDGLTQLTVHIRRCHNPACSRSGKLGLGPTRSENRQPRACNRTVESRRISP